MSLRRACKRCRRHLRSPDEVEHCRRCMVALKGEGEALAGHACLAALCRRPASIRAWWVDRHLPGLCAEHMRAAEVSGGLDLGGGWRAVPGLVRSGGAVRALVGIYWPELRGQESGPS